MPLTKEQNELLDEYERDVRNGQHGVAIDAYLPNVDDDAVWKLAKWSEQLEDRAAVFAHWLKDVTVKEIYRRAADEPVEFMLPHVPVDWTDTDLGDALNASVALMRANGERQLDDFIWQCVHVIAAQAALRLSRKNEQEQS